MVTALAKLKSVDMLNEGEYTPHGKTFDFGETTRKAILRFAGGLKPLKCGGNSEYENGNGSLMRILPIAFYLHSVYGDNFVENEEAYDIIHNISALTHAHKSPAKKCQVVLRKKIKIFFKD